MAAKKVKILTRRKRVEPLPTTWRKRLTRALVDPAYAAEQRSKWYREANHWTSCAVGERWALLGLPGVPNNIMSPAGYSHEHKYTDTLGMSFMVNVRDGQYADALATLNLMDNHILASKTWRTK